MSLALLSLRQTEDALNAPGSPARLPAISGLPVAPFSPSQFLTSPSRLQARRNNEQDDLDEWLFTSTSRHEDNASPSFSSPSRAPSTCSSAFSPLSPFRLSNSFASLDTTAKASLFTSESPQKSPPSECGASNLQRKLAFEPPPPFQPDRPISPTSPGSQQGFSIRLGDGPGAHLGQRFGMINQKMRQCAGSPRTLPGTGAPAVVLPPTAPPPRSRGRSASNASAQSSTGQSPVGRPSTPVGRPSTPVGRPTTPAGRSTTPVSQASMSPPLAGSAPTGRQGGKRGRETEATGARKRQKRRKDPEMYAVPEYVPVPPGDASFLEAVSESSAPVYCLDDAPVPFSAALLGGPELWPLHGDGDMFRVDHMMHGAFV